MTPRVDPNDHNAPEATSRRLRWTAQQLFYAAALTEIGKHLAGLAVPYMPIKGAYLVLSGLGAEIPHRNMLDIDLLVREEDFRRVQEHFSRLPNVKKYIDRWDFEFPFDYSFGDSTVHVEVHHRLNRPERFRLCTAELFQRGTDMGDGLFLPSHEDAASIAICHALVHITYFMNPKLFSDLGVIMRATGFSVNRFWKCAESTGVRPFFCLALRWMKEVTNDVPVRLPGCWYADLLFTRFGLANRYPKMSRLSRRLMLEIPFVRSPIALSLRSAIEWVHRSHARRYAS